LTPSLEKQDASTEQGDGGKENVVVTGKLGTQRSQEIKSQS
jgi:hypothetical protein